MPNLSDEAKEARNAYYRKYRAEHKDKVREMNRKYWEKKKSSHIAPISEEKCKYCIDFFYGNGDITATNIIEFPIPNFTELVEEVRITDEGSLNVFVWDGNTSIEPQVKINYCPMCGRKLVKNG